MKKHSVLTGLLLLAALLTGISYAQQPISDDEVNAVAKKLYCPVCENTPVDVCPTQVCADWRDLIRQQLSEGWSEERILDYFSANYGSQVLAQPPAQGFTVLVWILPLVALVGGGAFLWRLLRRGQQRHRSIEDSESGRTARLHQVNELGATGETPDPPGVSAETLARIESEVDARF
jgi:cytochrome c-type biogenesis protein CcmH